MTRAAVHPVGDLRDFLLHAAARRLADDDPVVVEAALGVGVLAERAGEAETELLACLNRSVSKVGQGLGGRLAGAGTGRLAGTGAGGRWRRSSAN